MASEKRKCSKEWKRELNPVVFFLSDSEKKVVDEAIIEAMRDEGCGTKAEKRRRAMVRICSEHRGLKRGGK